MKLSESRSEARSSSLILAKRALETFKMIKPERENIAAIFKRKIILRFTIINKQNIFLRTIINSEFNSAMDKMRNRNHTL